jgi:hypothetical protein
MARAIAAQLLFAVSLIASAVSAQTRPATSQPAQQVGLKFERMTVEVEPAIPAGLPVVFRAIIPNEGGQGKLLLTAPGKYLQGSYFSVRISRAGVEPKTIVTENGAASQGRSRPVMPATTMRS